MDEAIYNEIKRRVYLVLSWALMHTCASDDTKIVLGFDDYETLGYMPSRILAKEVFALFHPENPARDQDIYEVINAEFKNGNLVEPEIHTKTLCLSLRPDYVKQMCLPLWQDMIALVVRTSQGGIVKRDPFCQQLANYLASLNIHAHPRRPMGIVDLIFAAMDRAYDIREDWQTLRLTPYFFATLRRAEQQYAPA